MTIAEQIPYGTLHSADFIFDLDTELKLLASLTTDYTLFSLGYTEDELRQLGFDEDRIASISHQRAEFDANRAAHEAAEAHLASEVEKGEALLKRLPDEPTHGELRFLMECDREALYKSAGVEL